MSSRRLRVSSIQQKLFRQLIRIRSKYLREPAELQLRRLEPRTEQHTDISATDRFHRVFLHASMLRGVGRPSGSLNAELLCVLGVQLLPAELHSVGADAAADGSFAESAKCGDGKLLRIASTPVAGGTSARRRQLRPSDCGRPGCAASTPVVSFPLPTQRICASG